MPAHGGDVEWAAKTFGIAPEKWLDLSTGIAPWSWPVPAVPEHVWRRLPIQSDDLVHAAATYFSCNARQLLPIPGSQFLISRIPCEIPITQVAMPALAYKEHEIAWLRAGHQLVRYNDIQTLKTLVADNKVTAAVIVQPNNPTGASFEPDDLLAIQALLWKRHGDMGVLLVDEAFIDTHPEASMCVQDTLPNCLVLRSLGKFFGLAGLRLGFLHAHEIWRERLRYLCEPWSVSHPAQWIGQQALVDCAWINAQRERIRINSLAMQNLITSHFSNKSITRQDLFISVFDEEAHLYAHFLELAEQGILTRFFPQTTEHAILRIGLAGDSLKRFSSVLNKLAK